MTGRLKNKVALVTGGAQGIGEATARLFAQEGATVVVADRNGDRAAAVASEIMAGGSIASAHTADMGRQSDVQSLVAAIAGEHGRIDVLVNNAAAVHLDQKDLNVADADLEIWNEILRVNLTGPILASKYAIPHMVRQGGGSIVMVSSMSYRLGSGNRPGYDATKAGVNALARSIAVGFGKQGVRCNVVAPGLTLSPSVLAQIPPLMREVYLDHTMAPAIGQPRDQAAAILFLASDESAYVNGAVLDVDGGLGAHVPVVPGLLKLAG